MSLLEICCPHCGHHGHVASDRVPGMLRCSACNVAALMRDGIRTIRSSEGEAKNVMGAARCTDAQSAKDIAKPKRPPRLRCGKRILTPRSPEPQASAPAEQAGEDAA